MSLVRRSSQAAFVAAAIAGFLAGAAPAGAFAPRDLFGLRYPAEIPLLVLLAGAGLAAFAVARHHRVLLLVGTGLLLVGVFDTSARTLTWSAVLYALFLVLGLEFAFASERAHRAPDAESRAELLARYLQDARFPVVLVAGSVIVGAGLFLLLEPLLPGAFQASLERVSAFGVLAGALLAALALLAYGLLRRALRAARKPPAAPEGEGEAP